MDVQNEFPKENRRFKRKKKSSKFLRNAKGFAKQGIYGRGTHIDDDQYNYFINILDAMKNGFEDIEEKVNMANNVFEQTNTKEIHLSSNQIVCKVLESLIGFVDAEILERFFNAFAGNFRPICSDRFASHVLQKMVEIAFLRAVGKDCKKEFEDDSSTVKKPKMDLLSEEQFNTNTEFTVEHKNNCKQFVERVGKFLLNNLEDFVWDPCANHIMRTCILCLSGIHVAKIAFDKGGSDMARNKTLYEVSADWIEVMKEFPQRLEMWPQFSEFPYQELSSALIGVICIALKVVDKNMLKHFGKKILIDAFLQNNSEDSKNKKPDIDEIVDEQPTEININEDSTKPLAKVFESQSSVILLETLLTVSGPKLLTQLFAMLFSGRLAILAKEKITNFAVQKLLLRIKEKDDLDSIFTELLDEIEELLKLGFTGVVSSLTSACLRLSTKQAQVIVALQKALHVFGGDTDKANSFFRCLVKLKPYEIVQEDNSNFVHLHGSLIVQDILRFNKPIFLVNCILDTPPNELAKVFNTPNGSHISDAFLQSKFIGEKSREKLIRHLEGFYGELAITKFGSRVIENFFDASQESQKTRIVKELADKSNQLKSTPFGRLLHNKFHIETYRLSATQWKATINRKENKTEDLFKSIIS